MKTKKWETFIQTNNMICWNINRNKQKSYEGKDLNKRVTDERIKPKFKNKDMSIAEKYFETAIDNLVSSNKL